MEDYLKYASYKGGYKSFAELFSIMNKIFETSSLPDSSFGNFPDDGGDP